MLCPNAWSLLPSSWTGVGSVFFFSDILLTLSPYTSKYLLRRSLDPPNPPQTPSQKVLGGLGSDQFINFDIYHPRLFLPILRRRIPLKDRKRVWPELDDPRQTTPLTPIRSMKMVHRTRLAVFFSFCLLDATTRRYGFSMGQPPHELELAAGCGRVACMVKRRR